MTLQTSFNDLISKEDITNTVIKEENHIQTMKEIIEYEANTYF